MFFKKKKVNLVAENTALLVALGVMNIPQVKKLTGEDELPQNFLDLVHLLEDKLNE